ncbi:MAG: threonine synthase [Rhodospirillaceae bacterium TMED8]|nr:threonine synthase [Magnetovibrio sp.]OUT52226.1 MAG: threonine synthase [Rhodospirillaceae bacterium TMED8]
MKYVSTRGQAPVLGFDEVLLTGLARDGGLYLPKSWPHFSKTEISSWRGLSYQELAHQVLKPFVSDTLSNNALKKIIIEAYSHFSSDTVVPIANLGNDEWLVELYHGPTLAFKDIAMQFLGPLFDHVLTKRGERICIVGATSGDTGSAAIEALKNRSNINTFILYPHGRVSEVQRRQMTTVHTANIHTIALQGTFDDCQDAVKALFNDHAFRDKHNLSAVNSINWARITAQITYYFWAALKLGAPDRPIAFAVPTGNFGNIFAGYAARRMGLPIEHLVVGSNSNDILTRFFSSGKMEISDVHTTISPSMDIQISSNLERLLFELFNRDGNKIQEILSEFRDTGRLEITANVVKEASQLFDGARFDDSETKKLIGAEYKRSGYLLDPHTAIGVAAARQKRRHSSSPMAILATAHPAKFPDAVENASGIRPELPTHLKDLFIRKENINVLKNNLNEIKSFIEQRINI